MATVPAGSAPWAVERLTVKLSPAQSETLTDAARRHEVSKSQIVDELLRGYLRRAFGLAYPSAPRAWPGNRRTSATGMHSFVFAADQVDVITEALERADLSFAQLLEAAAADQFQSLYGEPWPVRNRANMPFGRPPAARSA